MTINVFLFVGDSYAVGYNMSAATLPAGLSTYNFGQTYIFTAGATYWGVLTPGTNTGTVNNPGSWGPAVPFAKLVHEAFPNDINLIVQSAKGSTPVAAGAGLDWSPSSVGEMFDITTQTLAQAKSALLAATGIVMPDPVLTYIDVGANDSFSHSQAQAFQTNFEALVAGARQEWGSDHVIASRLTDTPALPYNFDVRLAQWNADQADAQLETFKTIGMDMQSDLIHRSAVGIVQEAQALFDTWVF